MSNILFIGSELFFGTSVGSFRQDRWLKAFLQAGHRCTVLDYHGFLPRVYSPSSWGEYLSFREKVRRDVPKRASVRTGGAFPYLRYLKHFFILEIFHPVVWIKAGIILFRLRGRKFDFVFSSTPPFTSTLLGYLVKLFGNSYKFIIDFRDEWGGSMFLPSVTFIKRKTIERYLVSRADFVITVSEFSRRNIQEMYAKDNVTCVYNAPDINYASLLSNSAVKRVESRNDKFTFLYTGSIAPGLFNEEMLIHFILSSDNKFHKYFIFRFLGSSLNVKLTTIPEGIELVGQQPLQVSREMQQDADALLFLAANFPNNGGIVSSKIFEYLQSERPILPLFVHIDSDIYHIIASACGFCPIIHTWNDLEIILDGLSNQNIEERLPSLKNRTFLTSLLDAYPSYVNRVINA
jgi:glycosyltransferase involved in cell wall biosynthesis